ncbi:FadR/GntR family transcriptional regulator [Desulfatitalea tepidiphila]|jgi:GntR family transcriptional repressor for pyruvate dehydrogenase complex|uniref:FadR/GntR family transcriptional regulator n=1 Tax=Desulfatitalea tepidiphila TaxID=1185843 RepID=UPI0006B4EDC5|nr:FadR/GntR family transcriptional regulator [Desulfatitalea tepidiphila]
MTITLQPIKPKKISDQVFEQIRELIFRGQLKAGEQLLPERELSEAMQVSRTTVRNAINKLVVLGLLEHKQGQGTFVRFPDTRLDNPLAAAMEVEDATIADLLEVRMGLECNAAALAAQRANEEDLRFMDASLEEMRVEVASGRLGTEADTAFHMALAYATKNPVHVYIMKNFYDFLFVGIKKNLSHLYEDPANIDQILSQHSEIIEAIRKKDAQEALQSMHRHIQFVQDFFRKRG